MSLLFTKKIELGYIAPDFILIEPLTNKFADLNSLKGNSLLLTYPCDEK